ncbi:helix-turn-helix domain-containing protein [Kribbella sp. NPDC058245]|uniref:helix-turn-helix domain-containing protein n=1 Tax=Kribbella sp. NPDC058245 TaxID=3346399 RepID=UPI0036EB4FF9
MDSPTSSSQALGLLGARLRAVREQAGMSGIELAKKLGAGWWQPKVSKIETGRQLPTDAEISAWAEATGADLAPLLALRDKAAAQYGAWRDRVADAGSPTALQSEIGALETACVFLAEYQPAMVPGRLQTPAYIQGMADGDKFLAEHGITPEDVGRIIAAKVRRQSILYEPGRRIIHVVGEAALRTRFGRIGVGTLRAQLAHLAEMATLPGHEFGVVPFGVASPVNPGSGFGMYDRDLVVVETVAGDIRLTEPEVVAHFSYWIDELLDVALTGSDAAAFCLQIADELAQSDGD